MNNIDTGSFKDRIARYCSGFVVRLNSFDASSFTVGIARYWFGFVIRMNSIGTSSFIDHMFLLSDECGSIGGCTKCCILSI